MFAKELRTMTLVNDIADRLFDNITTLGCGMDRTFAATLRAVLHKRLPADESLHLAIVPLSHNAVTPDAIAESIQQNNMGHSYAIYIVHPQNKNTGGQLLDTVRSSFGKGRRYLDTYSPQEDLRVFYIRKLDGLFYTDEYSTIIFLDYLDTRRLHALQMMIPKYLPRLFADNPLSAEETALLKSLGNKSHTEYERLIEQFAQQLDMRSEIIRSRLKGFETVFERIRVDEVTQMIAAHQLEYQSTLDKLRTTSGIIQAQQILLAGLQGHIDSDSGKSELMEYFLCNKNLSLIGVSGTELDFVVHGYADIYDEDAFDACVRNKSSYLYTDIDDSVSRKAMERLYRAVFSERTYKLRVCAAYRADMRNSLKPLKGYIFPPESQTYLPNPHIQRFGCIGGYSARFMEYMHNRDYVGAIDQAAVSARNLNFYDSPVMKVLARTLSCTTIPCIEDTDGNLMTPKEAIKRLEETSI